MAYATYYKIIDCNGKVIADFSNQPAACFASYARSNQWRGNNIIELFVQKKYGNGFIAEMIFSKEEIQYHIKALTDCGFPATYEEKTHHYLITLNEENYMGHSHIRTALDFYRMLWEKGCNLILKTYFKLPLSIKQQYSYFILLQLIGLCMKSKVGAGHAIPSNYYGFVLLMGEIYQYFSTDLKASEGGSFSIWSKFRGEIDNERYKDELLEINQAIKCIKDYKDNSDLTIPTIPDKVNNKVFAYLET